MPRPIAFDLSRMLVGAAGSTPRGIDRIDMGYARHLLGAADLDVVGLLPGRSGMAVLRRPAARRFTGLVEAHWREQRPAAEDAALERLRPWLAGDATAAPTAAPPGARGRPRLLPIARRYAGLLATARGSLLAPARGAVPPDSILLGVGQTSLGFPALFRWLDHRPDVKPVFMLHDLIPLTHPEFVLPPFTRHHARMVETVARRAQGMIAISEASAADLRAATARLGRADLRIEVIPHPVDDIFLESSGRDALAGAGAYFVTVGVVDPRKNHRLLLTIWRSLVERGLTDIPKLVIAGSRGLRVAETRALLDRCPALRHHVIEASGLTSPALRDLIAGARGLLMPSFTEGFGLPIVEAFALGTPVIASDIPAHREVAGDRATLIDPLDGAAWRDAILAAPRRVSDGFAAQTWTGYFERVNAFLGSL